VSQLVSSATPGQHKALESTQPSLTAGHFGTMIDCPQYGSSHNQRMTSRIFM
jgi:hypothetical protein